MDKNEIIEMATTAYESCNHIPDLKVPREFIFNFAKLVAKAKADQLATALELGPVNDTAASIAIWIRQQ